MASGIALSTAGITVNYAFETTAGTRPEVDYVEIPDIQSIPDFDPPPNNIDVTTLAELEWMQYIGGLKDTGGSISFGALNTNLFQEKWAEMVDDYETAKAAGLQMWIMILIPDLDKAFYFAGEPAGLGLAAAAVNAALTCNGNITPTRVAGYAAKGTVKP